jgi:hypothetical protein
MKTQFGAWRLLNLLGKGKWVYATCDPFDFGAVRSTTTGALS